MIVYLHYSGTVVLICFFFFGGGGALVDYNLLDLSKRNTLRTYTLAFISCKSLYFKGFVDEKY